MDFSLLLSSYATVWSNPEVLLMTFIGALGGVLLGAIPGMTATMGRMHGDAQFAGSSSVPAHVEMMGLIGMGNNPMVGATVAVAVAVEKAMNK